MLQKANRAGESGVSVKLKVILVLSGLLLVAAVYAAATWWANQRTASMVVEHTAQALGLTTSLDYASVQLLTGRVRLTGLAVDNPSAFDAPRMMLLPRLTGRVRMTTLTGPVVEFSHLTLNDLELHLERRQGVGNYTLILDHYVREGRHLGNPELRFVIDTLVVQDAMVHLDLVPRLGDAARLSVPIHQLRLADVGAPGGGLMLQEVVGEVLRSVLLAVLDRAAGDIPDLILRGFREQVEELPAPDEYPPGEAGSSGKAATPGAFAASRASPAAGETGR